MVPAVSCGAQTMLCGCCSGRIWFLPDPLYSFGKHSCTDSGTPWILCTGDASDRLKIQKGALLLKAFLMLYLTAFLCGGFWEAVSRERTLTIKVFLLCVFVVYTGSSAFLFAADSIRAGRRNIYPVTFGYQGRVQSAYGLYDSGNLLEE